MPGATQQGARTAGWKYQVGHGFRRGQPVYLQSAGRYALASLDTGFDGLVGDLTQQQFQLVTGGELDGLANLTPNTVYSLTVTPGAVAPGSDYPIFKAMATDSASLVTGNTGTTGTDVVLPYTFSVTPLGGAVPIAGADGKLAVGWIPVLDYDPAGAADDAVEAIADQYLHSIQNDAVISVDVGNVGVVFDETDGTQVLVG